MDKKLFSRSAKFFKKEGFYVILFVCLCIVATVAAVTSRNSNSTKKLAQEKTVAEDSTQLALDETKNNYDNALQVKESKVNVPKDGKSSAAVSAAVDNSFIKPAEGTLVREFTSGGALVYWDKEAVPSGFADKVANRLGIDIKVTNPDKAIVAALGGVVEDIKDIDTETVKIIINHKNGTKTTYGNIDTKSIAEYKITKGKEVKKGDPIGRVSKSQNNPYFKQFGTYLNFIIDQGSNEVDPARYGIKYTKK